MTTDTVLAQLCLCGHIKESHDLLRRKGSPCSHLGCGCSSFAAHRDVIERREVRRVPHGEGFDYRRKQVEA